MGEVVEFSSVSKVVVSSWIPSTISVKGSCLLCVVTSFVIILMQFWSLVKESAGPAFTFRSFQCSIVEWSTDSAISQGVAAWYLSEMSSSLVLQ